MEECEPERDAAVSGHSPRGRSPDAGGPSACPASGPIEKLLSERKAVSNVSIRKISCRPGSTPSFVPGSLPDTFVVRCGTIPRGAHGSSILVSGKGTFGSRGVEVCRRHATRFVRFDVLRMISNSLLARSLPFGVIGPYCYS